MRKLSLSAALAIGWVAIAAPVHAGTIGETSACQSGEPAIKVNVSGLKDRTGRLKLELYPPNEADFLKDDRDLKREGKFFHRVWADTPARGNVSMCIKVPSPGRYALLFTHDRDGKNKFNLWQDGAGFPRNDKLGRKRPKLDQALITVGPGVVTANIRAQYLRGLSGFAPQSGD